MDKKISIIIADDNKNYAEHLKNILERNERIKIIGIANTDEEEIKLIDSEKPDIVITDLKREDKYTGIDIIRKYAEKENSPRFIIVSGDMLYHLIRDCSNIEGYLMKPVDYDRLVDNILKIYE